MTPDFFVPKELGKSSVSAAKQETQRWKWFQWKDEFKFLNRNEVEKVVIHPKWEDAAVRKVRRMLKRHIRDGYVDFGVSS